MELRNFNKKPNIFGFLLSGRVSRGLPSFPQANYLTLFVYSGALVAVEKKTLQEPVRCTLNISECSFKYLQGSVPPDGLKTKEPLVLPVTGYLGV